MRADGDAGKTRLAYLCDLRVFGFLLFLLITLSGSAAAQSSPDVVCPRFHAGATVRPPDELSSVNGVLEVTFHFQSVVDQQGLTRYCYITDDGLQAPTLKVWPGDKLIIHLENDLPVSGTDPRKVEVAKDAQDGPCDGDMGEHATNLHFHGMDIPPLCHQDEVLHTLVQPGERFDYRIEIPKDEPPGLYWYHPHPHGFSEGQVQGGASGAIIVEGIETANPSLAGMPERVLILRDQLLVTADGTVVPDEDAVTKTASTSQPTWDISINYVPVTFMNYLPARIMTRPEKKELWRVVNAAADTIFDLQLIFKNVPQQVQVVAIDGRPVDDSNSGGLRLRTDIPLSPGARVEFVVTTPRDGEQAQLVTAAWNTGPDGDSNPRRVIADIVSSNNVRDVLPHITARPQQEQEQASSELEDKTQVAMRKLYFSESLKSSAVPGSTTKFFITVDGQTPKVFSMDGPPAIVVHEGDVEDWVIENRSHEDHVFHIHQIHFRVLAKDGHPVNDPVERDTIDLPYWDDKGAYPSVKLRMDFRNPAIVGTFMFHCHILEHEDGGMMGTIQVLPAVAGH